MHLPFTAEQFLEVFRAYNLAVFPLQVLYYFLAAFAIFLAVRNQKWSHTIITLILTFLWLWMGIVYHLVFFTAINKAAYLFGALYIVQACLFFFYGIYMKKLSFRFNPDIYGWTGGLLLLYAMIIYPLLGYVFGHGYPASPTFGLPCPTTIFTFALLLWADKKFPVIILGIPFLWSIVGFSAAFSLRILEDTGLLVAGLLSTSLILLRNYKRNTVSQ
jgi:hypothetical protein